MNGATLAAIYIRVSTDSQAEADKTSLQEQETAARAYCAERGYSVVDVYEDVASGVSRDRPAFRAMQDAARRGDIDVVVAWASDRLARSGSGMGDLLDAVALRGVGIETVNGVFDLRYAELLASIARMERQALKERSKMGKIGAARAGRIPDGSVPYAYRIGDDGRPEVVEEEAEIVRRIFTMYTADGLSMPMIAVELEALTGRRWHASQLHRILGQSAYMGVWKYNTATHRETEAGRVVTPTDPSTWIEIPFPPIIDPDTYDRAQTEKRKRSTYAGRNSKTFYLLKGLLQCSECGLAFQGRTVKRKDGGQPYRFYRCNGRRTHGVDCRERPYLQASPLEMKVWTVLHSLLDSPWRIRAMLEERQDTGALDREIAGAERDLAKLEEEDGRLVRLYVTGKINDAMLDHQRRFVTERLEAARARLDTLRKERSRMYDADDVEAACNALRADLVGDINSLSEEGLQKLVRSMVDRVTIDRDGEIRVGVSVESPALTAPGRRPRYASCRRC